MWRWNIKVYAQFIVYILKYYSQLMHCKKKKKRKKKKKKYRKI